MLTRRVLLVGALATGLILRPRTSRATASPPATPVAFAVPAGACACQTHMHGDPARGGPARLHAIERGGVIGAIDAGRDNHPALDVERLMEHRHLLR